MEEEEFVNVYSLQISVFQFYEKVVNEIYSETSKTFFLITFSPYVHPDGAY